MDMNKSTRALVDLKRETRPWARGKGKEWTDLEFNCIINKNVNIIIQLWAVGKVTSKLIPFKQFMQSAGDRVKKFSKSSFGAETIN